MIAAINDIDRLLQAAPIRVINLGQAQVIVTAAPPLFHLLADGTPEHAEIELEATVIGVTGEVVWTCSGGTLSGVSGSSATLRYADLVAGAATVVASVAYAGQEIMGRASISVVRDGSTSAGAKLLELTPSEQVFKIDKAGQHSPAAIALTATGQNLTGVPRFTFFAGSGTLSQGPTSSQKVLAFADMSSDTVTIQVEQDGQVDRVTISKLRDGSVGVDGKNAITALLTNETVALPASSAGAVSSLVTAVCTMKVYEGAVDDTGNWSYAFSPAPNQANLTYTTDRSTVTVTGMAAGVDAAFIDITASKAGAASITKRFSLTKSKAGAKGDIGTGQQGQRGTVNIPVAIGGTTWSDNAAATALQNGGYGSPIRFDLVTLVNTAAGFIQTKVWDGDSWEEPGFIVNGNLLAPGTVRAGAIDARGLSIKDDAGNVILSAGASLAEQVRTNPNLVPAPNGWPFLNGAVPQRNGDGRFGDGQYFYFPVVGSPNYIGASSPELGIPANTWYTVSFDAYCDGASRDLNADVINDSGWDSNGKYVRLTNTMTKYSFTEISPNTANTATGRLRIFSLEAGGSVIVVSNIKVELGGTVTPWWDSAVTPANVGQRVSAGAITNTQFGGDLFSTNYVYRQSGWYLERNGDIYVNNIRARGELAGGAFVGWQWPAKGSDGFYLGSNGLLLGNNIDGQGSFIELRRDGTMLAPGFSLVNRQLTLENTIIYNPRIQTSLNVTLSFISSRNRTNTFNYESFTVFATISGANGSVKYQWSCNVVDGDAQMASDPSASSCTFRCRGQDSLVMVNVSLLATDDSNTVVYKSIRAIVGYGRAA
ncbi:hypothetical protein LK540_17250 [Massilia sp. IC2-278]|uniref:phage tail tip fiber protein n=1 Tax=Massilia sp. IC2-278 TaxID=2887200 RepID=UPI001E60DA7C|nr:hypothetical protein [Massilia sp. IC2-278]MCC2962176.1 hypothetical protein [Massilia sp. IC2-278]